MTERLDRQRRPSKVHARRNTRFYRRGYANLPHAAWGETLEPAPTLTSLVPNTSVVDVLVTVQVNGTNFMSYSTVEIDGVDAPTTYVSPTRLTYTATPTVVGVKSVHVNNDDPASPCHEASNSLTYTVTATTGELDQHVAHPENFTVVEIETWVDQHPEMADEVLTAELARPTPRTTLVDWLEGFIESRDGVDP
jgi:hypothetical protein